MLIFRPNMECYYGYNCRIYSWKCESFHKFFATLSDPWKYLNRLHETVDRDGMGSSSLTPDVRSWPGLVSCPCNNLQVPAESFGTSSLVSPDQFHAFHMHRQQSSILCADPTRTSSILCRACMPCPSSSSFNIFSKRDDLNNGNLLLYIFILVDGINTLSGKSWQLFQDYRQRDSIT